MINNKKRRIKEAITKGKNSWYFITFFIGFYIINFLLNKNHIFYSNIGAIRTGFATTFIIINFAIAFLVALTINLTITKFKETRIINKKEGSIATAGIIAGIIGAGCPACFVGVLPAIIGILGLGISFADYPYLGITIQIISAIILIISINLLSKDPVCKIPTNKK